MFERFTKDARDVVGLALEEARAAGAPAVEAEHLLLALAARGDLPGVDREDVEQALEAGEVRALAAVGIARSDFDLPPAAPRRNAPRWSASAKLALHRAVGLAAARHDRRITAAHVALGVLDAREGTVPRALDAGGIERHALWRRIDGER